MKNKNYTLGRGITGLVTAYLTDTTLITDGIIIPNESIHLFDFPITRDFLKRIGYDEIETKTVNIGCFYENKITQYISDEAWNDYCEKIGVQKLKIKGINCIPIDWNKLIYDHLVPKIDIICDKIIKIDPVNQKLVSFECNYNYDDLTSTIPATIFLKLCDIKHNLKCRYIKQYYKTHVDFVIRNYKYVYVCDKTTNVCRIYNKNNEKYLFEEITDEITPMPIIIDGDVPQIKNVEFVGRMAEWDNRLRLEDVIGRYNDKK
jgi:hypothetical protein